MKLHAGGQVYDLTEEEHLLVCEAMKAGRRTVILRGNMIAWLPEREDDGRAGNGTGSDGRGSQD